MALLTKIIVPDKRLDLPETRTGKIEMITSCFSGQPKGGWKTPEINWYLENDVKIAPREIKDLTDYELDLILTDLAKNRMILIDTKEYTPKSEIVELYADGGVINSNPSGIGGTWAFCGVNSDGERIIEQSGVVPATATRAISNNHTEQIAITKALEAMPDGWSGVVYSDSKIALGRVFKNWSETNLPRNISERSKKAVARLGEIKTVLLQGHPTKADLEAGIGKKRGLPVSIHNVWCDKACREAGERFVEEAFNKVAETVS